MYRSVATHSVDVDRRYEARRPTVSATTPVGTSKAICPTVNAALTSITPNMSKPAQNKNRVLTPQMSEDESVETPVMAR